MKLHLDSSLWAMVFLLTTMVGCSRTDMFDQPRYKPLAPSSLFADGRSARTPVAGTIARGDGEAMGMQTDSAMPEKVTMALLQRGRERFDIYCAACHGRTGEGNGMAVKLGFPVPPSLFSAMVVNAPDSHLYAVIGDGFGKMYGYGYRIKPSDRWAVVAYLRVLQLSRSIAWADLNDSERARLASRSKAQAP